MVRLYQEKDIENLVNIIWEAWGYYLQEVDIDRINELLKYYLSDDTKKIWLAFEDDALIGVAEVSIIESYRYQGEEARLELLYIRDKASNYYDVHSSIMDAIFEFLREEQIDFLRIDTTLENADILFV